MSRCNSDRLVLLEVFLLVACLALQGGCKPSTPAERRLEGRKWFQWATGLELPETAIVRDAKCFTVFAIGDTYYIELSASPELEAMLKERFTAERVAPDELTPPADWLKEMPFWTVRTLASPRWFSKRVPESGEIEWSCSVAYDANAGKCFFVGAECR